jgi:hypothetical protein
MSDIDIIKKEAPNTASEKSLAYFRSLISKKDITEMVKGMSDQWLVLMNKLTEDVHNYGEHEVCLRKKYAQTDVSRFITELLKCPKQQAIRLPNPETEAHDMVCGPVGEFNFGYNQYLPLPEVKQPLEDGMYRLKSTGTIYKVYHTVHGANMQVAKRLVVTQQGTLTKSGANDGPLEVSVKFKYEGRAPLYNLTPKDKLTMQEAKEFGALYGTCCICGRTLTNELSIHIGIGPVCGQREFGGEFEFLIQQAKIKLNPEAGSYDHSDGPPVDPYEYGMSATGAPLSKHRCGDQQCPNWEHGEHWHQPTGAPFSKQELEARLAEINRELGE